MRWWILGVGAAMVVAVTALPGRPSAALGGWALVELDRQPGPVRAGVPLRLGFMVKQHGVTPVHDFGGDPRAPIMPYLSASRIGSDEMVRAEAVRDQPVGHFVVDVTFPASGRWIWTIVPEPFAGTSFDDLKVVPADAPAGAVDADEDAAIAPPTERVRAAPAASPTDHQQAIALAAAAGLVLPVALVLAWVGWERWRARLLVSR